MNLGNAGKYAWSVGGAFVLVVILWLAGVIEDFGLGITLAALMLGLAWITAFMPTTWTGARKTAIFFVIFIGVCGFIVPTFVRIFLPWDIQMAWKTSELAGRMKIIRLLHDPDALGRHAHETYCRHANRVLTTGYKSEVAQTLGELKKLEDNNGAALGVLITLEKPVEHMTIDEIVEKSRNEKLDPVVRYHNLQRLLQEQRKNAVVAYKNCLDSGPKNKTGTQKQKEREEREARQEAEAGHTHSVKDISKDVADKLSPEQKAAVDRTFAKIMASPRNTVMVIAGFVALVALCVSGRYGSTKRYQKSDRWWWIMITALAFLGLVWWFF